MLGRGGRPPPCLLWFVARLNESENKSSEVNLKSKVLPSRLGRAGWMGGSSLSEELLSEAESDPVFIELWPESSPESSACLACIQPLHPNCTNKHQLDPIQCKAQCNREYEIRTLASAKSLIVSFISRSVTTGRLEGK